MKEGQSLCSTSYMNFNVLKRNFCNIFNSQLKKKKAILQIMSVIQTAKVNWIYKNADGIT